MIALAGLIVGFVVGLTGMGGGALMTPILVIIFRVHPLAAIGSDLVASLFMKPVGGLVHWRRGTVEKGIAKWLLVQLDSGKLADGTRLFSPRTTRELWSVVTPIRPGTPPPELAPLRANFVGYALGFGLRDYRGWKVVSHTGGLPGFVSRITFVPDQRLGIAVFTNQESGEAFEAITWRLLDHYFGTPGPSQAAMAEWTTTLFWYLFLDLKADPAFDEKAETGSLTAEIDTEASDAQGTVKSDTMSVRWGFTA